MRPKSNTFIISKEGLLPLGVSLLVWILSLWFDFLPWVFLVILLGLVWVYRNPERIPDEEDPLAILAPIDGKVTAIEQCKVDSCTNQMLCIRIVSSAYGVGVLRAPSAFTCKAISFKDGLNLSHETPQAPLLNTRIRMECESKGGAFWIGVQAGPWIRYVQTYDLSKPVRFGGRFGFGLSSKVTLYLPYSSRIRVNVGDKVCGGESVIGYFQGEQ